MRKFGLFATMLIVSTILILTGCNNDENDIPAGKSRLNILLTDSPFPIDLVSKTMVTIDKVEIRQKMESSMNAEDDSFVVLSNQEMQVDLLELTNGVTEEIASSDLEAGNYDMIRLHIVDATVELKDGSTFDLKIPSGSSSGLKIKIDPEINLSEGQTYDVLLDFDVSRSFVAKGNISGVINGFNFKPVIRGVFLGAAGRIEGNVNNSASVDIENAMVKAWLTEEGVEINDSSIHIISSFTDLHGDYKLIGLPAGTYNVICSSEGYQNDTLNDVSVTAGNATKIDFHLVPDSE